MQKVISKRECPGYYSVYLASDPDNVVTVKHFDRRDGADFVGWIARAEWSSDWYTDALPTKRQAMKSAVYMLKG